MFVFNSGICEQTVVLAGWIIALGFIFLVIFVTHEQYKEGGQMWSRDADAAYNTLARSAFALGIGWIIFACHVGYGGA